MAASCSNCKHYYAPGICRHSPPTPFHMEVPSEEGNPDSPMRMVIKGMHPPVGPDHICGQWSIRVEG